MKKFVLGAALSGTAVALSLTPSLAADPVWQAPAAYAPVYSPTAAAADKWTGFYAGAHVGGIVPDNDTDSWDWLGGVQAGYNHQFGNFVIGGELSASAIDSLSYDLGGGAALSQDWNVNALARGGMAFDSTLIYGTVGLAFAELNPQGTVTSGSDTHAGLAFGGGVEQQFGGGLGASLEYVQTRFDDVAFSTALGSGNQDLVNHTVKAGLNFHF